MGVSQINLTISEMSTAGKVVQDYKCTLRDLNANNKLKINVLTILADDYKKYAAEIVECIEEATYNTTDNLKLIHLYLIDSISKNVTEGGEYAILFSRNIVNLFKHVFQKFSAAIIAYGMPFGNECFWPHPKRWPGPNRRGFKPRKKMDERLNNQCFQSLKSDDKTRASLYKLRSTWANVFPKGKLYMLDVEVHSIDANWPIQSPRNGQTAAKPAPAAPVSESANVHVNPRFLNKVGAVVAKATLPTPNKPHITTSDSSIKSNSSSTTSTRSADSPLKAPVTMGAALKNLSKKTEEKKDVVTPEKKTDAKPLKKISELGRIPKKNVKQEQGQDKTVVSRKDSTERPKKTKKDRRKESAADAPQEKKKKPEAVRGESWKVEQPDPARVPLRPQAPSSPNRSGPVVPTAAPGSHAFNLAPRPPFHNAPPFGQNLRPAFAPFAGPPPPFAAGPPFPNVPFTQAQPAFSTAPPPFTAPPPTFFNSTAPSQPPAIKNETPRLPNLPGNNRIFVDGKAYEVFYLENVAVIERNGVPHRISFCGPPRDVIIDGMAHRMAFGETKRVEIDGHTHFLRFGAPSRELYMGDFPFKGAFGGPPIMATINGKRHEIRLMGPPPEVKIDQDPCYELMRHMQSLRQNDGKPLKTEKKELSIAELLSNIQKAGVLDQLPDTSNKPKATPTPPLGRSPAQPVRKSPSPMNEEPIIPANMTLDRTEELDAPTASLAEFAVPLLQKRYRSVSRDLYEKRSACGDCGILFEDMNSAEFRRHLDAHLQRDIADADPNMYSRTRPVFQSEETEEVNKPTTSSVQPIEVDEEGEQNAFSNETEIRQCSVCCEKFEEYFDDDSDDWRLRDCILVDGKAYHRACRPDPSHMMDTS